MPVHDTIARIISRLNPEAFRRCFVNWVQAINERTTEGELIAIDGKVFRGSYPRENRQSVICMVNAFATANGVVMGQLKINSKSNEITAIPELLRLLDIKGCLVSLDAIGCQTEIAKTIVQQGGDYLLTVKRNQKTLLEAVRQAFTITLTKKVDVADASIEKGHGRIETRVYHVIPAG